MQSSNFYKHRQRDKTHLRNQLFHFHDKGRPEFSCTSRRRRRTVSAIALQNCRYALFTFCRIVFSAGLVPQAQESGVHEGFPQSGCCIFMKCRVSSGRWPLAISNTIHRSLRTEFWDHPIMEDRQVLEDFAAQRQGGRRLHVPQLNPSHQTEKPVPLFASSIPVL